MGKMLFKLVTVKQHSSELGVIMTCDLLKFLSVLEVICAAFKHLETYSIKLCDLSFWISCHSYLS